MTTSLATATTPTRPLPLPSVPADLSPQRPLAGGAGR
jgi:hypothetical protein